MWKLQWLMIKFGCNARCHWFKKRALSEYKAKSWAKAVTPPAKLCYVRLFPGLLSSFFFVNWNVRISEPASSNRRTKQRFASMPSTVNWRYYNVSRDGNPQRENTMDNQSFQGFYAQLDCQITNGNENQTLLTLLQYRLFRVQKQNRTKQEIMKNIAN